VVSPARPVVNAIWLLNQVPEPLGRGAWSEIRAWRGSCGSELGGRECARYHASQWTDAFRLQLQFWRL